MKKILIVEDEKYITDAVYRKLGMNNFSVETAQDGKEALEKINKNVPDLILLDIIMPVMDGITFLKELKQTQYKDIPVIVLTNLSDESHLSEISKIGITDYVIKAEYSLDKVISIINDKLKINSQ